MDTYLIQPQLVLAPGPIVQLIQTPTGTAQIVTSSASGQQQTIVGANGQPVVTASTSSKTSTSNTSRSNKQILPKPPGNTNTSTTHVHHPNGSTVVVNTSSVSQASIAGNKQASITVTNSNSNNSINSSGNNVRTSNTLTITSNISSNVTNVGPSLATASLQAGPNGNQTSQILLGGPGKQPMSFISNPGTGTFLLNQVIPGLNHQPILIQGNLGGLNGVNGPLQLTLRQQPASQPQVVSSANGAGSTVVSCASSQSSPILSALNAASQSSVHRSTPNNQVTPTYVFQNQASSVTGAAGGPATMVMASGQSNLVRGQNIILTRPQNILGGQGPAPQLIQIQTPNGPMIVALQATPTLGPGAGAGGQSIIQSHVTPSQTVPITNSMLPLQAQTDQNSSNHPTLQNILQTASQASADVLNHQVQSAANIAANNIIFSQPVISQANHQTALSSSSTSNSNRSKSRLTAKSVNLAELLKETGILPDSSPPQSPSPLSTTNRQTLSIDNSELTPSLSQNDINQSSALTATSNSSNTLLNLQKSVVNTSQPTVVMVSSQPNHSSNYLLTSGSGFTSSTTPQLRLALAPDGSVFLQPNIAPSVTPTNSLIQASPNLSTLNQVKSNSNNNSSANNSNNNSSNNNSLNQGGLNSDQTATLTSIGGTKFIDSLKDTGSSQPSPDSTTPTLDASMPTSIANTPANQSSNNPKAASPSLSSLAPSPVLNTSGSINNNKQTLMHQINGRSTVKVGENVTSMTITPVMCPPPPRDDLKSLSPFIPLSLPPSDSLNNSVKDSGSRITVKQESKSDQESKTEIVSVSFPNLLNPSNSSIPTSLSSLINMSNCDNTMVQSSPMPVLLANTSLILQEDRKLSAANNLNQTSVRSQVLTPTSSSSTTTTCTPSLTTQVSVPTLVEQNGYQFVQISLHNHEFIERLETQIKKLSALKSPRDEQKQLLHELLNLQKKMSDAKSQPQNSNSGDGKVILTSISPSNQAELLLSQAQQPQDPNQLPHNLLQSQIQQHLFSDKIQNSTEPHIIQTSETASNGQQNLQLVNILNKNSLNAQQLRILAPTAPSLQMGTQLITIATPAKPQLQSVQTFTANSSNSLPTSSTLKQSNGTSIKNGPAVIQVVSLQPSHPSNSSTNSTKLLSKSTETITVDFDRPKAKISSFQQQVIADQQAALKPDTKTPFKSRTDACKRLLRYHVFNSPVPSSEQLSKVDRDFEVVSESLLRRKNELFNRFRYSLLRASMIETPKSECFMLDKLFINDETASLQTDKEAVAQGRDLNLPPAPESWKQILRDSLEEEERLAINRKRKSSAIEEDYLAECTEIKKYDLEDREDNDSEEEEENDDEEDETEENSTEDISKYLGPNQDNSVGDLNFYADFNHGIGSLHQDVNQLHEYSQRDDNQDLLFNNDWKSNNYMNNSSRTNRMDVWGNRYETENDIAVTTILGNDEDDAEGHENDLRNVDLNLQDMQLLGKFECPGNQNYAEQLPLPEQNGNQEDDEYEECNNEDDEDEEDDINEVSNGDLDQLPCPLDSILESITMQQPNQAPNQSGSPYYNEMCPTGGSNDGYRSYNSQMHQMIHTSSDDNSMLPDYRTNSQILSDPILDEAVRSISWS